MNHVLNDGLHYTTHHFIHLRLFLPLYCILFLPFKQCRTLLPPTQCFFYLK